MLELVNPWYHIKNWGGGEPEIQRREITMESMHPIQSSRRCQGSPVLLLCVRF